MTGKKSNHINGKRTGNGVLFFTKIKEETALKKRILSVLLAVLMLVGMIPMPLADAASTLEEAMADVSVYANDAELNYLTMNGSVKTQH